MPVEPITAEAPRSVRRVMLVQRWTEVSFLHWPVPVERVAPLLPPGTRPDEFEGTSYVGLVPFQMRGVGPLRGPGLPYLGTFAETNVRLYSVDEHGRRGVVFRSLDAARLIPALVGRLGMRLPYVWSRLRLESTDDELRYRCVRRGGRGRARPSSRIVVRPGTRIEQPSRLEQFLTARWGLHVAWHGRTLYVPNEHPSWPLHRAELLELDEALVPAAGLPVADAEPVSVLCSPGVPVRFGWPLRCGKAVDEVPSRRP